MKKIIQLNDVAELIKDGDQLLVGGFGLSGTPLSLIEELATSNKKDLIVVSNNLGEKGEGLGKLLAAGSLKKAIGSYFTSNREAVNAWASGELEIELVPQGTLAEAIRCAGAGIGGFYTKTAVGTKLAEGKHQMTFEDGEYILEKAIKGDVALIKALKSDTLGNLVYDQAARNFNPVMAMAAKVVIAEVDEIVEAGELTPEEIVTPHLFVDYIVVTQYVNQRGRDNEPAKAN